MADAENNSPSIPSMVEVINAPGPRTERRILLAHLAGKFFSVVRDPEIAAMIGKPQEASNGAPWCAQDFMKWIDTIGVKVNVREVMRVLLAMERVGLLLSGGYQYALAMMGQIFWSNSGDRSQMSGSLYLAEVFGAEVTIPCYNAVTALITAKDQNGDHSSGSGLVLDRSHVVTNRHVVKKMESDIQIHMPEREPVVTETYEPAGVFTVDKANLHFIKEDPEDIDRDQANDADVAVIEIPLAEGERGLNTLLGMAFRDPNWADETSVFGYPRVQMTTEGDNTVHRGRVVSPPSTSARSRSNGARWLTLRRTHLRGARKCSSTQRSPDRGTAVVRSSPTMVASSGSSLKIQPRRHHRVMEDHPPPRSISAFRQARLSVH